MRPGRIGQAAFLDSAVRNCTRVRTKRERGFIGYLASALVFTTFYMKTMIPLRAVAIASNVAFISYGYLGGMTPILILHVALLPLNLWRLYQTRQLVKKVRLAMEGDLSFDWLIPHMNYRSFAAGETIFRRGDAARELFLISTGTVRLTELKIEVGKGSMVGEIGLFSPHKARPPRQSRSRMSTCWRLPKIV